MSVEIKDGNFQEGWVVFHCPECEEEFGITTEIRCDYGDRSLAERKKRTLKTKRFNAVHENCGIKEIDERLKQRFPLIHMSDSEFDFYRKCDGVLNPV